MGVKNIRVTGFLHDSEYGPALIDVVLTSVITRQTDLSLPLLLNDAHQYTNEKAGWAAIFNIESYEVDIAWQENL
jgi:hypothetical protein